jgi:hypothetical protein
MTTRNCTIAAVGLFLAVSGAIALSAARRTWQASPHRRRWRGFPVTDSYHGVPVVDEYRWLENGDDPKVKAWVAAQNAYSHAYLSKLPQREGIVSFLKAARAQQHVRYADRQYAGALLFALKIDRKLTRGPGQRAYGGRPQHPGARKGLSVQLVQTITRRDHGRHGFRYRRQRGRSHLRLRCRQR